MSIEQRGANDVPFPGNVHRFAYYDDVSSDVAGQFIGFDQTAVEWDAGDQPVVGGMAIPDDIATLGQPTASALGGTRTFQFGTQFYAGYNQSEGRKPNSYGMNGGHRFTYTHGLVSLVDIDGDALPDRVFRGSEGFAYNRNLHGEGTLGFAPEATPLPTLTTMSREFSLRQSIATEGYPSGFHFHVHSDYTLTWEDSYFSDVNGDGLVDIINDRQVFFNRLGEDGVPIFDADSTGTPVPIGRSALAAGLIGEDAFEPPDLSDELEGREVDESIRGGAEDLEAMGFGHEEASAPVDVVRRWRAPYEGRIRIRGTPTLPPQRAGADGVVVSIQRNRELLWTRTLTGTPASESHDLMIDNVGPGERFYFRVHSREDGRDDLVAWSPRIEYQGLTDLDPPEPLLDENGLSNERYDATVDFALGGRRGASWTAPLSGTVHLVGTLRVTSPTDDVHVEVRVGDNVELTHTFAHDTSDTFELDRDLEVQAGDHVSLHIRSDSPVDLGELSFDRRARPDGTDAWGPWLHYTSAEHVDDTGNVRTIPVQDEDGNLLFETPLPIDITTYEQRRSERSRSEIARPWIPPFTGTACVGFGVAAAANDTGRAIDSTRVAFTVKNGDELLDKYVFEDVSPGAPMQFVGNTIRVDATEGEPIYFSFTAQDGVLFDLLAAGVSVRTLSQCHRSGSAVPSTHYGPELSTRMPQSYRGWSYAAYNAAGERGEAVIDPDVLEGASFDPDGALEDAYPSETPTTEEAIREATLGVSGTLAATPDALTQPLLPLFDAAPCIFERVGDPDAEMECRRVREAHWQGPEDVYVTATSMSSSLLGLGRSRPGPEDFVGAQAPSRLTWSVNISTGGGATFLSGSNGVGYTHSHIDYFDLNGDSFPDVIGRDAVQLSRPLGVLETGWVPFAAEEGTPQLGAHAAGDVHHSQAEHGNLGLAGNPSSSESGSRGQHGTAPRYSGGTCGTTRSSDFGASLSISAGGGHAATGHDYQDVNGDGLPDRVIPRGGPDGNLLMVALNLGYHFADFEPWGVASIHEGWSQDIGGGAQLSFNSGDYELAGGINAGYNDSALDALDIPAAFGAQPGATLLDINGDGLLDRVAPRQNRTEEQPDGFWVWLNLGHAFAPRPILWRGRIGDPAADISRSRGTSVSIGGFFTFSVPICWLGCFLVFNTGIEGGESTNHPVAAIRDIDGDGNPDHLFSEGTDRVRVARNRTGRTDLLRRVVRPMRASFELDYERAGNTQQMPQSRWVLSRVRVFDGARDTVEGEAPNDDTLTRVRYEAGRYDRFERDFYGFERVIVEQVDTRGWNGSADPSGLPVYRRSELAFHNDLYARRGLLREKQLFGSGGELFGRTVNTYELRDAASNTPITDEAAVRTATVFPALTRVERFVHEGLPDQLIPSATTQEYDLFGNVTRFVDSGGPGAEDDIIATMEYSKDRARCVTNHIVGVATKIVVESGGDLLRERQAEVDCAHGTVTEIRTSVGDGVQAVTNLVYDADGNLVQVMAPANVAGQRYTLDFAYDTQIQTHIVSVIDTFEYVSSTEYDLRFGAPTRETDMNGASITTSYDDFGRVASVLGPLQREGYTIRFFYFPSALPVPYARTEQIDVGRADPIVTLTYQDGLGRTLQVKRDASVHTGDESVAEDVMIVSGRTQYDPWGRAIASWHPSLDRGRSEAFLGAADDSAPATRMIYDVLDRVSSTSLPDGSTTRQEFSLVSALEGRGLWAQTRVIDANGASRDALRDTKGRIRAVVEHLRDGTGGTELITTRYEYDALDQIRRVADADGNVTSVDYDLAGRRTSITHPDSGTTTMSYDAAGNLTRRQTANLRAQRSAIEYRYDFTHLIGIDYPSADTTDVMYEWGAAALRGQAGFRVGRITRVEDASGSEERSYDALGQIVTETRAIASPRGGAGSESDPQRFTTHYRYDTWGRLQQVVYPDSEVVTYGYDAGGRVRRAEGVKLGLRFPYVERLEYDRFGQRTFQQTGNGIRTHYEYDPDLRRLERLRAGEFQNLHYAEYDDVGNIRRLENEITPDQNESFGGRVTQSFSYDSLHRLTHGEGTFTDTRGHQDAYTYNLTYSRIHNITSKAQEHTARSRADGRPVIQRQTTYEQAYTYGRRPHAPTQVGERELTYDPNGNLVGMVAPTGGIRRSLVWDDEDRVLSISDNGRSTQFVYDAGGQRRVKLGAQGETVYPNQFWVMRNSRIGTKHIYVGETRIASKITPAAGISTDDDLLNDMLGRWMDHRSDEGDEHAQNVDMNPHYRVPSTLPEGGTPETNFLYFYHPDHLASTQYVTDRDGELYQHVQYFPSGETWVEQHASTERLPYLFTSQEIDRETDLYYFGARYYDPRIGTWLSTDPAAPELMSGEGYGGGIYLSAQLNSYAYAANNPVRLFDPDGQQIGDSACGAPGRGCYRPQPPPVDRSAEWRSSPVVDEIRWALGLQTELDLADRALDLTRDYLEQARQPRQEHWAGNPTGGLPDVPPDELFARFLGMRTPWMENRIPPSALRVLRGMGVRRATLASLRQVLTRVFSSAIGGAVEVTAHVARRFVERAATPGGPLFGTSFTALRNAMRFGRYYRDTSTGNLIAVRGNLAVVMTYVRGGRSIIRTVEPAGQFAGRVSARFERVGNPFQ